MLRKLGFLLALGIVSPLSAELRIEIISPQSTDPAINQWLTPHYVVFDTADSPRNQLFVFMHGLGGVPAGCSDLIKTAAMERYHAVGVTYPNDWAPFTFCQNGSDPNCYENLRREILDGIDRSPHIAVSQTNCFENRLIKLVQYLDGLHPTENWDQFLSGGAPDWSKIVVWGHSQGATNAAVLAKHQVLARLIMSAPPADAVPGGYAQWWYSHVTPTNVYFGFCHTQDQLSAKVAVWNILGMGAFGGVQDVASIPSPYNNSHELSTSVAPAQPEQYHNSVVADNVTPRDAFGEPVYRPAWRYLMTPATPGLVGDMNCDGNVNLADIDPFTLALINPTGYSAAFPACQINNADANSDASVSGADVAGFVSMLLQ